MRVAIPVWQGRVSPVFDEAQTIQVSEIDDETRDSKSLGMHPLHTANSVSLLADLGIDVLVCSAVSRGLGAAVRSVGVAVISDICGPPEAIVSAMAAGDLELLSFRSPGRRHIPSQKPSP